VGLHTKQSRKIEEEKITIGIGGCGDLGWDQMEERNLDYYYNDYYYYYYYCCHSPAYYY